MGASRVSESTRRLRERGREREREGERKTEMLFAIDSLERKIDVRC